MLDLDIAGANDLLGQCHQPRELCAVHGSAAPLHSAQLRSQVDDTGLIRVQGLEALHTLVIQALRFVVVVMAAHFGKTPRQGEHRSPRQAQHRPRPAPACLAVRALEQVDGALGLDGQHRFAALLDPADIRAQPWPQRLQCRSRHRQTGVASAANQPATEPPHAIGAIRRQQIGVDINGRCLDTHRCEQVAQVIEVRVADHQHRVATLHIAPARAQAHGLQVFAQLFFDGKADGLGTRRAPGWPLFSAQPTAQFHGQHHLHRLRTQRPGGFGQGHAVLLAIAL
ncbi:hypothetical protein D3C77_257670 [compost metagenome]